MSDYSKIKSFLNKKPQSKQEAVEQDSLERAITTIREEGLLQSPTQGNIDYECFKQAAGSEQRAEQILGARLAQSSGRSQQENDRRRELSSGSGSESHQPQHNGRDSSDVTEEHRQVRSTEKASPSLGNITDADRPLYVPYEQKDVASALGARWNKELKSWYAPAGSDLDRFKPWLNPPVQEYASPEQEFSKILEQHGLILDAGHPIMDGKWHRLPVDGDKTGAKSGSYIAYTDGVPRGTVKNFKTGQETNWTASTIA